METRVKPDQVLQLAELQLPSPVAPGMVPVGGKYPTGLIYEGGTITGGGSGPEGVLRPCWWPLFFEGPRFPGKTATQLGITGSLRWVPNSRAYLENNRSEGKGMAVVQAFPLAKPARRPENISPDFVPGDFCPA